MASPVRPLAKCVARWIYEQASSVLEMLKAYLLSIITAIDVQIASLRAWLLQWDILAQAEQWLWEQFEQVIDAIREQLMSAPEGPLAEFCPEFYSYFMEPARNIFENSVSSLTIFRSNFADMVSYMDEIDQLISYWEDTKVQLVASVDIIDDAIYIALQNEAESVP